MVFALSFYVYVCIPKHKQRLYFLLILKRSLTLGHINKYVAGHHRHSRIFARVYHKTLYVAVPPLCSLTRETGTEQPKIQTNKKKCTQATCRMPGAVCSRKTARSPHVRTYTLFFISTKKEKAPHGTAPQKHRTALHCAAVLNYAELS